MIFGTLNIKAFNVPSKNPHDVNGKVKEKLLYNNNADRKQRTLSLNCMNPQQKNYTVILLYNKIQIHILAVNQQCNFKPSM